MNKGVSMMAKLKLPSFDGGTLLQRTLLYVVTFVLGSAGFVAIASVLIVWAAKSVVPARQTESSASTSATDKVAELAPTAAGKPAGKRGRPNRGKPAVESDAPAVEDTQ
jgi:hypothetical protein